MAAQLAWQKRPGIVNTNLEQFAASFVKPSKSRYLRSAGSKLGGILAVFLAALGLRRSPVFFEGRSFGPLSWNQL